MGRDIHCKYHPDAPLIEEYSAGDVVCSECGLVVGDRVIDVGAEWRSFANDGNERREPSRVGGPENKLLSDCGLTSVIGASMFGKNSLFSMDTRFIARNVSSSDQVLKTAFSEISNMAARINLPQSIIDRASYLFKEINDINYMKYRSVEARATACLYIACRQEGVPRTIKEICAISRTPKRDLGRCFKIILRALNINLDLIKSSDFMSRFCATLGLPVYVEREATHIAQSALKMNIMNGRSPISIAAAAIFMASQISGGNCCYRTISDITGVTECTIKRTYREMRPHAKDLIPKESRFYAYLAFLVE